MQIFGFGTVKTVPYTEYWFSHWNVGNGLDHSAVESANLSIACIAARRDITIKEDAELN